MDEAMKPNKIAKWVAFTFMSVLGFFWIFPVIWLILNSFRSNAEFITSFSNIQGPLDYISRIIPREFTIANYIEIFVGGDGVNTTANLFVMFRNSFIVSLSVAALVIFITSLSAYAFERLDFPGGNAIFWTLLAMSMFPNAVGILPMFRIASALNIVNNLNALIWPALTGVFNIFLLRNFLKGVPKEFDEAARMDGANSFQIYLFVIVPLIKPVMIIVGLFAYTASWNDFVWPSIVMTDVDNQVLTAGLRLLQGQFEQRWTHLIAACLVSMVPPLLIYLFAQKHFLRGISIGAGVKG